MAKKRSLKGKGSYASYKNENRLEKNREARRARHAKRHPNDKQSQEKAGKSIRQASNKKGNFPAQKFYAYDRAGHKFQTEYNKEGR